MFFLGNFYASILAIMHFPKEIVLCSNIPQLQHYLVKIHVTRLTLHY